LADIKRSEAQQEVKRRNANFTERLTNEVDYLVVGSKANSRWKFGDYGNKINEAIKLRDNHGWPLILSENDFLEALSLYFPTDQANGKYRLLVVKYEFYNCDEDVGYVTANFEHLATELDFGLEIEEISSVQLFLYHSSKTEYADDLEKVYVKLVKCFEASDDLADIKKQLTELIERFVKNPGKIVFRDIMEGTGLFVRYTRKFLMQK
jgi:ribosomal protein S18